MNVTVDEFDLVTMTPQDFAKEVLEETGITDFEFRETPDFYQAISDSAQLMVTCYIRNGIPYWWRFDTVLNGNHYCGYGSDISRASIDMLYTIY